MPVNHPWKQLTYYQNLIYDCSRHHAMMEKVSTALMLIESLTPSH